MSSTHDVKLGHASVVLRTPLEAPLRHLFGAKPVAFENSSQYWVERYQSEGWHSGAGSYGRLAEFKAEVLNDFVAKNDVQSVLELGSGDGTRLPLRAIPPITGLTSRRTRYVCAVSALPLIRPRHSR